MCPACITSMALVAAGAASTGGLTAFIARTLHRKHAAATAAAQSNPTLGEDSVLTQQLHRQGDGT